jgi:hypothetical protein
MLARLTTPTGVRHVSGLCLTMVAVALGGGLVRAQQSTIGSAIERGAIEKGVIEGRVVEAQSNRPIAGAHVQIWSQPHATETTTDADGRYEVRDLPPGRYRVNAQASGFSGSPYGAPSGGFMGSEIDVRGGQVTRRIDLRLPAAGAISGRVLSDSGEGLDGVEVEVLRERYLPGGARPLAVGFAQTEALGVFRIAGLEPGEYYVRAYTDRAIAPPRAADVANVAGATTFAPTFFPGVTRVDEALPVLLTSGQELFDLELTLVPVRALTFAGRLVDPEGSPFADVSVRLVKFGAAAAPNGLGAAVAPDGRFEIRGLVPGDYMLHVLDRGAEVSRWGAATQSIAISEDVADFELLARPGAQLVGRIVRDGNVALPFDASGIGVEVEQRMTGPLGGMTGVRASGEGVATDGTFSINAPGGTGALRVSRLPEGWMLKGIDLDGLDITDEPVELGGGGSRRVEIVLTDRTSGITGTVTDRSGKAVARAIVVAFPEDRARWGSTRLLNGVAADDNGSFRVERLPPGNYRVVAVDALAMNAWQDADVLDRLWPIANALRLLEGEQRAISLRIQATPSGAPTGRR